MRTLIRPKLSWILTLPVLAWACGGAGDLAGPAAAADDQPSLAAPSFHVTHSETVDTWAVTDQDLWMDCVNDGAGENTDWSGTIDIYYTGITTPSGNEVWQWRVDYYTATPLSFTGDSSGDLWQLVHAEDNGGSVAKPNGTQYQEHWQYNEFYMNQDGERMHSRVRFQLLIDENGSPQIVRFVVGCN